MIPYTVTSIGRSAFSDCSSLISIDIPNSVKTIGSSAFNGCANLTSFTIPSSVKSIESGTFWGCIRLTSITIPNSVTSISGAFGYCDRLTSIVLPSSLTTIEVNSFYYCRALKSIIIPGSVKSIGNSAFEGCGSLTSIHVNSTMPIDLSKSSNVFYNVSKVICALYVPNGSKTGYQNALQWKDFLNIIEVSTGIQTVSATELGISIEGRNLILKNLQNNEMVQVFTIDGKMVFSEKAIHKSLNIPLITNKMYIVKVGLNSAKIILK